MTDNQRFVIPITLNGQPTWAAKWDSHETLHVSEEEALAWIRKLAHGRRFRWIQEHLTI